MISGADVLATLLAASIVWIAADRVALPWIERRRDARRRARRMARL